MTNNNTIEPRKNTDKSFVSHMSIIPAAIVGIKGTVPFLSSSPSPSDTSLPPTCLLPLVGREYLGYYSSLNALVSGKDVTENKPRPLSSMEQAESWLVIHAQATDEGTSEKTQHVMATSPLPETVTRLSSDQQSIHPLQVDSTSTSSTSSSASLTAIDDSPSDQQFLVSNQAFSEPIVRKKTSFASKLRKVFIAKQAVTSNSGSTTSSKPPVPEQQARCDSTESSSMVIDQQHRGSVSSASSTNSAERRGSTQSQSSITPSTSPEMSPVAVKPSTTTTTPSQETFVASPTSQTAPSTPDLSSTGSATTDNDVTSTIALPPTQTRTVKKRLSFASISSFFNPKNNQDQETRSKQQRSSSVPHVENPLVTVGRQIAGFQRRHSLNDLHEAKKKQQEQAKIQSWTKDQDAAVEVAPSTTNGNELPTVVAPATAPIKSKLRLNNVFGKGRKSKKYSATGGVPKPENLVPAKPLRPVLVHRAPTSQASGKVHKVASRRRSSSVRSNQSNKSRHRRNSQAEEAASESNASSGSSASGTASLSRKSLEEHQAMINSLPSTAQQPQYTQHRERGPKHRRQGSQASRESDRLRYKSHHQHSASNSARDYQGLCSLPVAITAPENDAFASPVRPTKTATRVGGAPLATAPTPRVLAGSSDVSKRSHNHVRNPLSSLSPSSSCCSFTSDQDDEEEGETRGSLHESFNGRYSSSSPSSSVRSSGSSSSRTRRQQLGSETFEDQSPYNPLLPAAAARISVDRITMENAQAFRQDGSSSGSATLASDSSSSTLAQSKEDGQMYAHHHQQHYSEHQDYQHHYIPEHQQQQQQNQNQQASASSSLTSVSSNRHNLHQHVEPQYYKHPSHCGEPDHPHHHQQYYHPDPSTYPPRPPRQLQFSTLGPLIHPTWTAEQYDRTSDSNITALRLTPQIAHKIKLELNHFKSQEMEVHQESRVYTHFFV
ncbi:hypothetical protein MVEG_06736 [Podila verticillata NRRL 6337]|nr:hypothetical protein MVEG_06736 [Podila verticillata NRRL 6337]